VHPLAPAETESAALINDLPAVPADSAPPQVVEVMQSHADVQRVERPNVGELPKPAGETP
jgi:hypothetical protein